jgi:hypothetical protein
MNVILACCVVKDDYDEDVCIQCDAQRMISNIPPQFGFN